jgi:dihydroorotate dehydrogenase electron transfer subunit
MGFDCGTALREALPGQFVMLQAGNNTDPLLRRPFSLCRIEGTGAEILYRCVGKATAMMAEWKTGQAINFIGPLGKGFTMPETTAAAYLVAGGIGIAPLLCLMQYLERNKNSTAIKLFMGGKTADDVSVLDDFNLLTADVFIATENGDRGFRGIITDLFRRHLEHTKTPDHMQTWVFGCGPSPMAHALSDIAEAYKVRCQLSLEAHMACGIGACLGCVVKTRAASTKPENRAAAFQYQRVCAEGPVFESKELVWDT